MENSNITWHPVKINKSHRVNLLGQRQFVLWFTGLSGSGKSTISCAIEEELHGKGYLTYLLDGDNVRHGLCNDLGFTAEDRKENIRRVGEVSKLFLDAGVIVIAAFISPFEEDRKRVRSLIGESEFIEVYLKCPIDVCKERDPKGIYLKARTQGIKHFTGIDDPYDEPKNAEITIETDKQDVNASVSQVISYLRENGFIK